MSTADPFTAINAANSANASAAAANTAAANALKSAADGADRFLKLLVTQMQNQDPLNPMDNAQVTSQMAQISTVSGIEKLNGSVSGLNDQFVKLQALQGASLVGRGVTLQGNRLDVADGVAVGGFELASAADSVRVEILNGAGRVVDTLQLGAETAGRHGFSWPADAASATEDYRFRVTAMVDGKEVRPTTLMRDIVVAVDISGDGLLLQTGYAGSVAYSDIKTFN